MPAAQSAQGIAHCYKAHARSIEKHREVLHAVVLDAFCEQDANEARAALSFWSRVARCAPSN